MEPGGQAERDAGQGPGQRGDGTGGGGGAILSTPAVPHSPESPSSGQSGAPSSEGEFSGSE